MPRNLDSRSSRVRIRTIKVHSWKYLVQPTKCHWSLSFFYRILICLQSPAIVLLDSSCPERPSFTTSQRPKARFLQQSEPKSRMPARKRAIVEVDASEEPASVAPELHKLRNMWEFASLMQYIYLFGECVRINPDVDIDVRSWTSRPLCASADPSADA